MEEKMFKPHRDPEYVIKKTEGKALQTSIRDINVGILDQFSVTRLPKYSGEM